MRPGDMSAIAGLMARVLVKGEDPVAVQPDVIAFRHQFQRLHFVFPD
jgi:hypothetical protein